jgi:hypothetical protein
MLMPCNHWHASSWGQSPAALTVLRYQPLPKLYIDGRNNHRMGFPGLVPVLICSINENYNRGTGEQTSGWDSTYLVVGHTGVGYRASVSYELKISFYRTRRYVPGLWRNRLGPK